ncbi:MAG: phosphoribosyltransferase [Candidatus Goldiibacteriota bacterium]
MFRDRKDAGQRLGRLLERYKEKNPLVLAIPNGGARVGYEAAGHIDAEFSLIISRKLPMPDNPEAGFGAVAEDGSVYLVQEARQWYSPDIIQSTIEEQKRVIQRRITALRNGEALPDMKGRTVIVIDDGIAMGSTMRVSAGLCGKKGADRIIAAAPVSGQRTARELKKYADEVITAEQPPDFRAVASSYEDWYDVDDAEVIEIMEKYRKNSRP